MPQTHNAMGVANAFLHRGFNERLPVDPMKLQKLIFLAHGYYLARHNVALVDKDFEAWTYGPVIPDVYREFRRFGARPITELATVVDWESGEEVPAPAPEADAPARRVIEFVWRNYKNWTSIALSELSHKRSWAWDRARNASRDIIQDRDIAKDFSPFINEAAA